MAVVFISPKQRQRMFFVGITVIFLLFLVVISFIVFLAKPKEVSPVLIFNKPKVNVDMNIFDSDLFKNLQQFAEMETHYAYKATTADKELVESFISAVSMTEARKILEDQGLTVNELKEAEIGRDNPFIPYYQ